jgi:phosphoserine phosphatase RsbU/P
MPKSRGAFWRRISEGIELQQLWAQFHAEARASYELYSKEVDATRQPGESRGRQASRIVRGLFWAMMMKLSPGRRVLFLIALVLLLIPGLSYQDETRGIDFHITGLTFLGALLLLILFALELADRVMMKRDLEIAREIQGWLMPAAPPVVPGVDIAFASRAANTVAGDYYDAFFRPAGQDSPSRLLLVVADVAGKSIPAALLMATLQASLRTLAGLPTSLLELVERLNQYAYAQNLGGRRFTTAFLAELEPATGRLTYVNAGHNWPVLQRASGGIERLEAGGLPLGIMPKAPYECGNTALSAGDLLLIFTDGLVEAEDETAQEFDEPRMLKVLSTVGNQTAADVLKRLMGSVDAFVGLARQHDDITCMVVRTSN